MCGEGSIFPLLRCPRRQAQNRCQHGLWTESMSDRVRFPFHEGLSAAGQGARTLASAALVTASHTASQGSGHSEGPGGARRRPCSPGSLFYARRRVRSLASRWPQPESANATKSPLPSRLHVALWAGLAFPLTRESIYRLSSYGLVRSSC